jgi:hypothetical protein
MFAKINVVIGPIGTELSSSANDLHSVLTAKTWTFDPAKGSEYRRNRNDIPNIYGGGCKYGYIDILLGFSGSEFISLWDFDWCRFVRMDSSITLVVE